MSMYIVLYKLYFVYNKSVFVFTFHACVYMLKCKLANPTIFVEIANILLHMIEICFFKITPKCSVVFKASKSKTNNHNHRYFQPCNNQYDI